MIRRILYIGYGNIPSRYAHGVQSIKAAEGFARCGARVTMLTQCAVRDVLRSPININEWYGIRDRFRIMRLPIRKRREEVSGAFVGWAYPRFNRIAARIARAWRSDMVVTPVFELVRDLADAKASNAVLEAHEPSHPAVSSDNLKRLTAVVAVSPVIRDEVIQQGVAEEKVLLAPNAVDIDLFDGARPAQLRAQWGVGTDWKAAVGYCGHLYENRGVDLVLDCASRMKEVLFVLVGGWPHDVARWKSRYHDLCNVRFEGFVSNALMPLYQKAADVLLMPYSTKCNTVEYMCPMKLPEYMAAGKAIIASDLPALKHFLRHGENAVLVPPDDSDALLAAIGSLLSDETLRVRLGERARRDISGWTWETRGAKIIEHVERLRDGR